jgi:hypothetical protein
MVPLPVPIPNSIPIHQAFSLQCLFEKKWITKEEYDEIGPLMVMRKFF